MIPHRRHRTQVGVAAPRVYVIDLLEDTLEVVEPPPDGVYEGQPAFSPVRPRQLATVVWTSQYRKLWLIYCFNLCINQMVAARLRHRRDASSMAWRCGAYTT